MHSVVLRGLKTDLLESGYPTTRESRAALEQFVMTTDARIKSMKILIDTRAERGSKYSCFAYLNYDSESDAASGKQLFESAIFHALTGKARVDASHMIACVKTEAPKRNWAPVFSIWVGNIFSADEAEVKQCFNRFGSLSTMAVHGLPPFKVIERSPQRSAIFNYINFTDAQAALGASHTISFGAVPVIARPRGNMRLVQRVLSVLKASEKAMPFDQVQQIADRLGDERPDDCIALLRVCRDLFVVDVPSSSVTRRW